MKTAITFEKFYIEQGDNPKGVTAHNAWQHQQSIIDEQNKRIDCVLALIDTTSYSEIQRRMPDFIDQIKDILKGEKDD